MPARPLPLTSPSALADKIRELLRARGLSLAEVSRDSTPGSPGTRFGHVPHNLYDAIRKRRFSPSLHQVAALSALSGYRFVDWLELFGLHPDDVGRFQVAFPAPRTVELDSRTYQSRPVVPSLRDITRFSLAETLVPLSRWVAATELHVSPPSTSGPDGRFRFVKIGSRDAFAFPDLIPGSIVRVDQSIPDLAQGDEESESPSQLVLVRHGRGLVCTRIQSRARNRIVLCPTQLPYAPIELELQKEAEVLGTADFEIRPLVSFKKPTVAPSLASYRPPAALERSLSEQNFGHLIQRARQRLGLSFREASGRTRLIAQELGDTRYFCASSALSDYEAQDSPPRHIHKLISICAVYFISPEQILQAAGISAGSLGQLPIPLRALRDQTAESPTQEARTSRFMGEMERLFRQIPYFLHRSIAGLFGLPKLSVRDVFWCGENYRFVHPSLSGAVLLVVDRRKKILRSNLSCPVWAQPLYIFLRRDGSFLCGSSTQSNGILSIRPCTAGLSSMLRLRNRIEVEVVGQIVGVVRRLRDERIHSA